MKTPLNKNVDIRENGRHIELLLFNQILHRINITQALYILNEENYKKSVNDFVEGFNQLNEKDLNIKGVFGEFNSIKNIDRNKASKIEALISTEPREEYNIEKDIFIEITDENDVIGA